MRAIREQPRLTIARVLLALCLIAAGAVIGAAVRADDRAAADAAQARLTAAHARRLTSIQRRADRQRIELRHLNARLERSIAARGRAVRALRAARRATARIRRQLTAARRALRQQAP